LGGVYQTTNLINSMYVPST